jgi:hypothetical protein
MFGPVGQRSARMLVFVLAAAIAVVTASCSAEPRGTTNLGRAKVTTAADLARAKADCAAAGRSLGAPPGDERAWIQEIMTMPRSGIAAVDAPRAELAAALRGDSTARTSQAFAGMVRACARLGLWQAYH